MTRRSFENVKVLLERCESGRIGLTANGLCLVLRFVTIRQKPATTSTFARTQNRRRQRTGMIFVLD